MFKELDKGKLAARAVTGFVAGAVGAYVTQGSGPHL